MNETRPSLMSRVFDSIRYRAKLALVVFCVGAAVFYVGGHALNQGFESSVVVTYPLPPHDPLLPPVTGTGPALIAILEQNPALDEAFHQADPQASLVARLGARADRAFYRTHLTIAALPTSLHNSIPLSVNAKESTPENAQALAHVIGQAIYHQAVAQQPIPPPTPQPTRQATPSDLPPSPPPSSALPPISELTAAPSPPKTAASPAPRHYIKPPPLNSDAMEQRKSLTDELIAAEDRRVLLTNELNGLDALERTQSVRPPPVRSFNEATLRTQISESRATLNDLEKRYTERHPDVIAEKDRLRDLQTKLEQSLAHDEAVAQEQATAHANLPAVKARVARQAEIRPELAQLNTQINHDTAEIDRLSAVVAAEADTRRQIEAKNAAAESAPVASQTPAPDDAAKQAAKQAADRAAEREQVRQLTQRVQAYLQSGAAHPAQSSPSQPTPTIVPVPSQPSFPSPTTLVSEPTVIVTALLLALLAALLSIVLTEGTGRSINNARGLEKELPAGVEFLGEIPRMSH